MTYEENTYPRPVTIIDRLVVDTYKQALPKPTAGCVIHINIDDINIINICRSSTAKKMVCFHRPVSCIHSLLIILRTMPGRWAVKLTVRHYETNVYCNKKTKNAERSFNG